MLQCGLCEHQTLDGYQLLLQCLFVLHVSQTVLCNYTASYGAAAGGIIYFISYLPFSFFGTDAQYPTVSAKAKFSLSLVPNLAMGIGCKTLGQFESTGTFDFATFYYFALVGGRNIMISLSNCLSLFCLSAHVCQKPHVHTSLNFYTCYMWPWLGPRLTTMQYVMHFMFYG